MDWSLISAFIDLVSIEFLANGRRGLAGLNQVVTDRNQQDIEGRYSLLPVNKFKDVVVAQVVRYKCSNEVVLPSSFRTV